MSRIPPSFSGGLSSPLQPWWQPAPAPMPMLQEIRVSCRSPSEPAASRAAFMSLQRSCRTRCAAASRAETGDARFPLSGMRFSMAQNNPVSIRRITLTSTVRILGHRAVLPFAGSGRRARGRGRMLACTAGRRARHGSDRCAHVAAGRRPRCQPRWCRTGHTRRCRESRTAALSAIATGRDVTLQGDDDTPDRYGRQPAFVFLAGSDVSVQTMLLTRGDALVAATVTEPGCAATLAAAEASARAAKRGIWANSAVIKNAESADDILAGIGRFMVVDGTVLSVRQAGEQLI